MWELGIGKIPPAVLEEVLRVCTGTPDPRVVVGPRVGTDAAIVDVGGGQYLVVAGDPITFTSERIGWYAVHVNANDVAVCGARPQWFLVTVLLPPGANDMTFGQIMRELHETCASLGVTVIGGHSEVTPAVTQPVVIGSMLGLAARPLSAAGARPGDILVCAGAIAIEGTAVLAAEYRELLVARVGSAEVAEAAQLLVDPGISVVAAALAAADAGASAMHDVTEGGILTAVWEMATASGCGVRVDLDAIPVLPATQRLCAALGVDPYRLLGSGCLLIASPPERVPAVCQRVEQAGSAVTIIGAFEESGLFVEADGELLPLEPCEDELARIARSGPAAR